VAMQYGVISIGFNLTHDVQPAII